VSSQPSITGKTRLYAIIGDPVSQVRSPEVFTERFAALGKDAVLVAAHVPPASFDSAVRGLMALGNMDGLLVTLPYKNRIVPLANRLGPTAELVGAINALRREADGSWTGDMFDGAGMVRGIQRKGYRLAGRRAVLFGCGGAGSAIAVELARAGVAALRVVDPEQAKASALVALLQTAFPACEVESGPIDAAKRDLIVNASPVGMRKDDGLPMPLGALSPETLVADVVVRESPTALIAHAQRYGCQWTGGKDMHSGQIEEILRFFGAA
jgi:shikimate dehydrogenase